MLRPKNRRRQRVATRSRNKLLVVFSEHPYSRNAGRKRDVSVFLLTETDMLFIIIHSVFSQMMASGLFQADPIAIPFNIRNDNESTRVRGRDLVLQQTSPALNQTALFHSFGRSVVSPLKKMDTSLSNDYITSYLLLCAGSQHSFRFTRRK